jgi:hypothetical protein
MATLSDWERVREKPLGSGGQSTVYLVRRPERRIARDKSFGMLKALSSLTLNPQDAFDFATASADISRKEDPAELGALKVFNPRAGGLEAEQQALGRMKNEIAVLKQKRPGLLKLLDSSESENSIVTEYCPCGTLAEHLSRYKGNAKLALTAFYSLVKTVMDLHKESIVHRDIIRRRSRSLRTVSVCRACRLLELHPPTSVPPKASSECRAGKAILAGNLFEPSFLPSLGSRWPAQLVLRRHSV